MTLAVIGTGMVGRTLAQGWSEAGHEVLIGTRDPDATAARDIGGGTFAEWLVEVPAVRLVPAATAVATADVVVNATEGLASVAAMTAAGLADRDGVVLIDVANALDFSAGFPPSIPVARDDSLAEQLQRAFPRAHVVKTLNTVNAGVMVDPAGLAQPTTMFLCGDDSTAKSTARGLLTDLGWRDVLDLGDLTAARALESYLPLWLRIMQAVDSAQFNIAVVRSDASR